jgi:hypothetical protein
MRHELFDLLLLISCAFALWKGGAPERLTALTFLVGDLVSVVATLHPGRYRHEEYGLFSADILVFVALCVIAFRSTRWWPLFPAGLQLDGVLVHLIHFVAPKTIPIAYLNATGLWAYPMVFILAGGTWRHLRRMSQHSSDPPWKRRAPARGATAG